jgi:G:T-mismatch repair DNA endonuclease (very short patch repair protein)
MDPVVTPTLLYIVLGSLGKELIEKACRDYLTDKMKKTFFWLEKLGEGNTVRRTYHVTKGCRFRFQRQSFQIRPDCVLSVS